MQTKQQCAQRKRQRIFVNTFWQNEDVRNKVMKFAEKEGIVPSKADILAQMRAKMGGHTIFDDFMC